jgi:hypothetical protein
MNATRVLVIRVGDKAIIVTGPLRRWPNLWDQSRTTVDSDATRWLHSMSTQPDPDKKLSQLNSSPRTTALAHARGVKKRLIDEGVMVLSMRRWETYAGGNYAPIPVIAEGVHYPSASKAAEALCVTKKTILTRCRRGDEGYSLLENDTND